MRHRWARGKMIVHEPVKGNDLGRAQMTPLKKPSNPYSQPVHGTSHSMRLARHFNSLNWVVTGQQKPYLLRNNSPQFLRQGFTVGQSMQARPHATAS